MGEQERCDIQTWVELKEELEAAKERVVDARGRLKDEERALEMVIEKVARHLDRG